jgi:hypothetical protein
MTIQTDIALTVDHRVVGGAPGAALQTSVQFLIHPALFFTAEEA